MVLKHIYQGDDFFPPTRAGGWNTLSTDPVQMCLAIRWRQLPKFWCGASARQARNPSSKQAVIWLLKELPGKVALSPHACTNTRARAHVHGSSQQAPVAAFLVTLSSAYSSPSLKGGSQGVQRNFLLPCYGRSRSRVVHLPHSRGGGCAPRHPTRGMCHLPALSPAVDPQQHRTCSSPDTSIPWWSGQSHK